MKNKDYFNIVFGAFVSLVIGFFVLIFVAVCGTPNGIGADYSKGSRVGNIVKLSHKGIFFKSYEGELVSGGTRKVVKDGVTSSVANVIEFSTSDENVAKALVSALESGETVELRYNGWMIRPWRINTDTEVVSVKIVK